MRRFGFTAVLMCLLAGMLFPLTAAADESKRGDLNNDGGVDIADVVSLIHYVLSGEWPDEAEPDWVDLGLPSGTIWATRNVGASSPEEYGDYFAWGETEPKSEYSWISYKWAMSDTTLTKYCSYSDDGYNGFVDNKTELDPSDDAACAHYPGGRMPSQEQINELIENCTWQWTQRNGVNGQLVTGPNGNTMFLPAAGDRWDGSTGNVGLRGYYWSRTLFSHNSHLAGFLRITSGGRYYVHDYRIYGLTVRAVRVS